MSSAHSGSRQPKSSASSQRPPVPAPKQQSAPVSKPAQSVAGKPKNDSDDLIQWVGDVVKVKKNPEPKVVVQKVVAYTAAPATRITVTNQTPDVQPKVTVEEGHIVTEIAADDLPAGSGSSQAAKARSSDELRLKSRKPEAKVEALSPKKSGSEVLKRDEENVRKEMGKLQIKTKHEVEKPSSSSRSSGDGSPFCQPSTSKVKDEEMDTDREKVKKEDTSGNKTPEDSTSEDEDGTVEDDDDSDDDDENRDMYSIPPENLDKLSLVDRAQLMRMIELSKEIDKRIRNINTSEDALQDEVYVEEYVRLTTDSERLLNKIIKLAGFEDNDQENDVDIINGGAMKPFNFRGSGDRTLDKCITMLVRKLLEQDPLADRVRINERGFEDGALAKLGPQKIGQLIAALAVRKNETHVYHEVPDEDGKRRKIMADDVYVKVRDTIKKYRAKLFNKTVIPKFAGTFNRIYRPDSPELEEMLKKAERETGVQIKLDEFAESFEKNAKEKGFPTERDKNDNDVVEADEGDDDDDDEEDNGNDAESIATTSSMNELVDGSLNTPVVARSSKRQSGSETEPEGDTSGSKRAKSDTPDETVNTAVVEEDPTDYPDDIMEMLGGA